MEGPITFTIDRIENVGETEFNLDVGYYLTSTLEACKPRLYSSGDRVPETLHKSVRSDCHFILKPGEDASIDDLSVTVTMPESEKENNLQGPRGRVRVNTPNNGSLSDTMRETDFLRITGRLDISYNNSKQDSQIRVHYTYSIPKIELNMVGYFPCSY